MKPVHALLCLSVGAYLGMAYVNSRIQSATAMEPGASPAVIVESVAKPVPVIKESLTTDDDAEITPLTEEEFAKLQRDLKRSPDCDCESCECKDCQCKGPETQEAVEAPIVKAAEPAGLYFWAAWCGPCKAPHATVEEFVAAGMNVELIDSDAHPELRAKYGITALPAFVRLGTNGFAYEKIQHALSRDAIAKFYGFTPPANYSETPKGSATLLTATPRVYASGRYGSGTVIDDGMLLTAAHVMVDDLTGEYRAPVRIVFGDTMAPAEVVGHVRDQRGNDLALLSFDAEKYPAAVIPVADAVTDANAIFTSHGYPGGRPQIQERRINLWNARRGPNGRQELANPEQRFASQPFLQGESGGGVTDASGNLVGVVAATDGRMGYVVSLEAIRKFLGELRSGEAE